MPGVYILTGDNAPDKERYIQELLAKELKQATGSSFEVYHASDAPVDDIVSALSSGSLFGGATVVLIRGGEFMLSDTLESFAPYIASPSPSNTLIIEGENVGKRLGATHPFMKALDKAGPHITRQVFSAPPPYKLAEWLSEQARSRYKRPMDKAASEQFVNSVGDDLFTLVQELDKLDIVLAKGAPIKAADIDHFVSAVRMNKPWDIGHPVALKETHKAVAILRNLIDFNTHPLQIVSALFDHFSKLYALKAWFAARPEKLSEVKRLTKLGFRGKDSLNPLLADAANESGYSGYRKMMPNNVYNQMTNPGVMDQMEKYSYKEFNYILRLLASADYDLKSGGSFGPNFGSMLRLLFLIILSDRFRTTTRYE